MNGVILRALSFIFFALGFFIFRASFQRFMNQRKTHQRQLEEKYGKRCVALARAREAEQNVGTTEGGIAG